ncbi:ATP-dependent endonuclease, partial [Rhizobium ruizarguesonis]
RRVTRYFTLQTYVLDPTACVDPEHGRALPQALNGSDPIEGDPFKGLIRIDEISAQRGFGHAGESKMEEGEALGSVSTSRKLSAQLRQYYKSHLDPYESPDAKDLLAL